MNAKRLLVGVFLSMQSQSLHRDSNRSTADKHHEIAGRGRRLPLHLHRSVHGDFRPSASRCPQRDIPLSQGQIAHLPARVASTRGQARPAAEPRQPRPGQLPAPTPQAAPARFTPQQEANSFHARGSNHFFPGFPPKYPTQNRIGIINASSTPGLPARPAAPARSGSCAARRPQRRRARTPANTRPKSHQARNTTRNASPPSGTFVTATVTNLRQLRPSPKIVKRRTSPPK